MIIINARFLTQSMTGVQRYALEISRRLRIEFPDDELQFIAPPSILHQQDADFLRVKLVGRFTGHLWEQLELPFYVNKKDLLVNFCNTAPILIKNKIVAIHDLAYHLDDGWYNKKFKIFYNFLIPKIFKSSVYIVTVSETIKKEMINHFGSNYDNNIFVIPCALASDFTTTTTTTKDKKTLLTVGSLDPRKNLTNLIKAFDYLENDQIILKVVGGGAKNFKVNHLNQIQNNQVYFLGRVSDDELRCLYEEAYAFIFPSFYEGFGIPPLEALNYDCILLGSDIPVFKEIYQNSMIYFDPKRPKAIAEKIDFVFKYPDQAEVFLKGKNKILSKYSFDDSSEKWKALIQSTLQDGII
ncbi:MAG TPA: glycosyltransferase family 1 protein [Leeuwenhoekiella sp.]|nr:glycosyltransferase family 1 protein [Leeuwenhoekiella sp.]|tara:strand:+ start:12000 stop:13061 length:1062 start_codon:yes stop_codon:yes gene_type:complete